MKQKLQTITFPELLRAVAVMARGALCSPGIKKNYVSTFYFCPYKFLIFFFFAAI